MSSSRAKGIKTEIVPRSKHLHLGYKKQLVNHCFNQLMLYSEITTVCSDIDTERINTLCGDNVENLNVNPCSTCP